MPGRMRDDGFNPRPRMGGDRFTFISISAPTVFHSTPPYGGRRPPCVGIKDGEVFLYGAHFSPYTHAARENLDPVRPRKLLLHAQEIRKLAKDLTGSGTTLVPTRLYLKEGRIKIEIALARGKQQHDKRESMRRKDADREMRRATGTQRYDRD